MNKIYFIILQYIKYDDTCQCINSILNNIAVECYDVHIVVVDNASANKAGDKIRNIYINNPTVIILENETNLGFSKGNNVGFRYAKSNGADYIVQINNDTIINDRQFIDTLIMLYKTEKYAVLGPDILSLKDNLHQNPIKTFTKDLYHVDSKIIKNEVGLILNVMNLDQFIKKNSYHEMPWNNKLNISTSNGYALQGACLIFSPIYIECFDGMFEGTFMFYEEHILEFLCERKNLKMIYSPALQILHKEGSTQEMLNKNDKQKRRFKYIESIKSLKSFSILIKNNSNF